MRRARRGALVRSGAARPSSRLLRMLVALLIVSQLLLTFFRGQDLPLDAVKDATVRGIAVELLALHEHDELHDRGLHQHDGLPIHLHVPEDDFHRRWIGEAADLGIDRAVAVAWPSHALLRWPARSLTRPWPPRSISSAPPREVDLLIRSLRLRI